MKWTPEGRRALAYLEWAEALSDAEPRFLKMPRSRVSCLVFDDEPEDGSRVALTYGLSTYARSGKGNELLLLLASLDDAWLPALMQVANASRKERCHLQTGMTESWPVPISDSSPMTGFVLWEPFSLPEDVPALVPLPGREVLLWQAVPLHPIELAWLRATPEQDRLEAAFELLRAVGDALTDPQRPTVR